MRHARTSALVLFLLCLLPGIASAQDGKLPWQEYDRLVEKWRTVAPLNAEELFGEQVDLYSGVLTFSATDVSIPGNNSLPVEIRRKLTISDRGSYGSTHDDAFGDWDLDIPNVSGVFSTTWHDNRCTQPTPPTLGGRVSPDEYWAGNQANLPGGGEMLQADIPRTKPSTGGPHLWVTKGDTYFSCLSTIQNGSGEGFLAIAKDGTKYWLNHMAQYFEPEYLNVLSQSTPDFGSNPYVVSRRKNVLYATRIEDRFGNWVNYTYTNSATQPIRLTRIESSDGRVLTLAYNGSGYVSSVNDGSRTWTYQYNGSLLSQVVLPDTRSWSFNLAGLSNAIIEPSSGDSRTCFTLTGIISGDATGSITHPSGASATFTVGPRRVGRTNVPAFCANYQPDGTPNNDRSDDYLILPYVWPTLSIKSKQIEGPGLTTGLWTYALNSSRSWLYPPGQTEPICQTETCLDPVCLSDSCAGTRTMEITGPDSHWQRYTFGNSYRYNEGKLLKQETGSSASSILKSSTYTYNYATSGQPYSPRIGTSPQVRGAGFVDEYPRPQLKAVIVQDGASFTREVATGCNSASPSQYCFDDLVRPKRVVKTGIVATGNTGNDPVLPPASAPTLTAPASSYTGNYSLSWTSVTQASSYELQERLGSGSWETIQIAPAASAPINSNGTGSWSYQVRACNVAGCSAWSATKTVAVTLPPSSAPVVTAPATNTTGSYTVSWTAVSTASRYELDQRKDAGAWSNVYNSSATSKALSGLTSGSYDHRARACNDAGCGGYSTNATTVVTLASLGAPTLTVDPTTAVQGETIQSTWTAISGATQYQLERNRNGGAFSLLYTGSALTYSVSTGLTGTHRYRVKACDGSGCGPYSAEKEVFVQAGGN